MSQINLRENQTIKVQVVKNKRWLAEECIVAASFLSRLRGLIGKTSLNQGEALLLRPCNDIHMWFMSVPIDVVFLSKPVHREGAVYYHVTSVHSHLKPWKLLPVRDGRAVDTLELPVGTALRCEIAPGDELCIS